MEVDIIELLVVFDELTPATDEERGIYWFEVAREDGLTVNLFFSIHEDEAGVLIYNEFDVAIANVDLKKCSKIRVLDQQRKCLEILHENGQGRCFLSLLGDSILDYTE